MPYAILVVEDHPVMREVYADVIASEPDLVLHGAVSSVEEALHDLHATDAAGCDLILTDYRLPGRSGVELVREAGACWPGLPVLVISAHEEDAFAREAHAAGATAFLPKRNLFENLVPAIRAALAPSPTD